MSIDGKAVKGRGAADQPGNRFNKQQYGVVHWEGIDEPIDENGAPTKYLVENPKTIINRVTSPDLGFHWSMNPYQGCEHGCSYCYARPTHEYWGYSAGLDFERVVIVKRNAPELFENALRHPKWKAETIMVSGATDPYQPVERDERITRRLLEIALAFKQPIGLITKNALVLRDLDLLTQLAEHRLVHVALSITTQNEDLRRVMEPRTSTAANRFRAISELSKAGVPTMVMTAPIIPGLNDSEIPALLKAASEAGALQAGYTVLRTNGTVKDVFEEWLRRHFPDRAEKVLNQTRALHGGVVQDSTFGRRMKGEGAYSSATARTFSVFKRRYFAGRQSPPLDPSAFKPPPRGQLQLF